MNTPFWRLWGAPLAIGAATALGLVGALLADGIWDDLAALALAVPVVAGAWHGLRRR